MKGGGHCAGFMPMLDDDADLMPGGGWGEQGKRWLVMHCQQPSSVTVVRTESS
jgi:hypothetical protein